MSLLKIKRVVSIIFIIMALLLSAAIWRSVSLRADNRRLENNQRTLMDENRRYMVRDSLNAVSTGILTMRISEFRGHFEELNSMVRDLNVKVKRLESVSRHATESRYEISATVRDTLVPQPGVAEEVVPGSLTGEIFTVPLFTAGAASKYIVYDSDYLKMEGMITDSVFRGTIMTFDTLTQVVHRIPRRFLFIKWGTKELRQEIVSSNPHTTITYSEHIRITR